MNNDTLPRDERTEGAPHQGRTQEGTTAGGKRADLAPAEKGFVLIQAGPHCAVERLVMECRRPSLATLAEAKAIALGHVMGSGARDARFYWQANQASRPVEVTSLEVPRWELTALIP